MSDASIGNQLRQRYRATAGEPELPTIEWADVVTRSDDPTDDSAGRLQREQEGFPGMGRTEPGSCAPIPVVRSYAQRTDPLRADDHLRSQYVDMYRARYPELVQIARLTTGSRASAEDLVQDAFADVHRRFNGLRSPEAYLRRAVLSRCTSWVRRRALERRHQPPHLEPVWTDPDTVGVLDAVNRLPVRQRAVVVMRYFADWSEADIANALGCRPGTVKSLLARARTQLAKEFSYDH